MPTGWNFTNPVSAAIFQVGDHRYIIPDKRVFGTPDRPELLFHPIARNKHYFDRQTDKHTNKKILTRRSVFPRSTGFGTLLLLVG